MTSKHKRGSGIKKAERALKRNKAKETAKPIYLEEPKSFFNFTRAQLASLLFISIGYAKSVELSTASKEDSENPAKCLEYLGQANEDTCMHPSFTSLILAKYYSGLSLAGYLVTATMILWKYEAYFLKFMTLMAFSPLAMTAVVTVLYQGFLERSRVWHILILASVLYSTVAPQSLDVLPYLSDRTFSPQTIQTKALMVLTMVAAWDLFRVMFYPEQDLANSLIETSSPLPTAASLVVSLWMVDKLAMMLIPVFAMVHLPVYLQRSFLFFIALIKGAEFIAQATRMPEPYTDLTLLGGATFGSAVVSAFASYA